MRNKPIDKSLIPVLSFTLFYVAVATAWTLLYKNYEFGVYIAEILLLILLIKYIYLKTNLPLSLLWCLSLWGFTHMAGGLVPVPETWPINGENRVLYSLWLLPGKLKYDQVIHAYGFGITTWACWQGMKSFFKEVNPTIGKLTVAAAAGMGFGALNEIIEFIVTLLVPKTNVGGYVNTGWDLVANLAGALIAVVLIKLLAIRRYEEK